MQNWVGQLYLCLTMKICRKISFGILFTLIYIFCFELFSYSNNQIGSYCTELLAGSKNVEHSFSLEIDSFDDDQIYRTNEMSLWVERRSQMLIPRNSFLIHKFFLSVWQPPKISQNNLQFTHRFFRRQGSCLRNLPIINHL